MKKLLLFGLLSVFVVSCEEKQKEEILPPSIGSFVTIDIEANCPSDLACAAGTDLYPYLWELGDAISVIMPTSGKNNNLKFTAVEKGESVLFEGRIASWEGIDDIYAIYPYKEYEYDVKDNVLRINRLIQSINVNNQKNKGVLVAKTSGASVTSSEDFNIPSFDFKLLVVR